MNIFERLLNNLPKIPGWKSRPHREDNGSNDDEYKHQIVYSGGHGGALVDRYVQKRPGPPPAPLMREYGFMPEKLEYGYFQDLIKSASRYQTRKRQDLELRCIAELKNAVCAYEEQLLKEEKSD